MLIFMNLSLGFLQQQPVQPGIGQTPENFILLATFPLQVKSTKFVFD